jgi:hypothetical protein
MVKKSKRSYARSLGLRVTNDGSRLAFDEGTFAHDPIVHKMWLEVEHARTGGPPLYTRQPFEDIVRIVNRYGKKIWNSEERSHLLFGGEEEEYVYDLVWPEDRDQ